VKKAMVALGVLAGLAVLGVKTAERLFLPAIAGEPLTDEAWDGITRAILAPE